MAKMSVARAAGLAAEGLAQEMGYIFVDAELAKEHGAAFLRIFVDVDDEGGMSLQRCEAFHRALVKRIGDLEYDYLEVSSPGIDRPLKRDPDYKRNLNREIEVRLFQAQNGEKSHAGTLLSFDKESIELKTGEETLHILRKNIAKAAPVLDLEEELKAADEKDEEEEETEENE